MVNIVMTFCRFARDANLNPVGDPMYAQVRGRDEGEINASVQTMRWENDMVKFTPWNFVRLDSVEVI